MFSVFSIGSGDCSNDQEASSCSPTSSPLNSLPELDSVSIPFSRPFIPYTPTHLDSTRDVDTGLRIRPYSDSRSYQKTISPDFSSASPLESPAPSIVGFVSYNKASFDAPVVDTSEDDAVSFRMVDPLQFLPYEPRSPATSESVGPPRMDRRSGSDSSLGSPFTFVHHRQDVYQARTGMDTTTARGSATRSRAKTTVRSILGSIS
ncbi:hypothetical protein NEOLEDRAFT_615240 [Neolentinus lepideus HHB14362 ss-1]|uniref:Uncharacterized protein n=1 Tax=Neolentinus lepideus HHB14362 ss-1 TaxID=1314782 RepID=A0A165QV58_9AGAM|nr:hypothetical protein NEOLEDRAFT_615240 [Neolentinus lepideus HHB14362 ss-1]